MAEAIKLYATTKQIDAAIESNQKRGAKWQDEAHRIACSVLQHVGKFGDVHVVDRFLASMPEAARTNGLRQWFEAFGNVRFVKSADGKSLLTVYAKDKPCKLGEAMLKPFWKFKATEGVEYEPKDAFKLLDQMIGTLTSDAAKRHDGVTHSHIIHALKLIKTLPDGPMVQVGNLPMIEARVIN